ncbi:MAG: hypothetical protein ACP59X_10360 [Solidesulfovibrio sp. DCME]|uniref:hypothetical protein n=1 Tax=Solidesulfovibrio sp. DCME TaxID=3447380 RepID=UPI003D11F384
MNKIKMKPKRINRTSVNNKFALTPSAQGEISRTVLYNIKLKKLIRFLTDYGEKSGMDYERLCALVDAIEKIINKNNEIKKQNKEKKDMLIGGYGYAKSK